MRYLRSRTTGASRQPLGGRAAVRHLADSSAFNLAIFVVISPTRSCAGPRRPISRRRARRRAARCRTRNPSVLAIFVVELAIGCGVRVAAQDFFQRGWNRLRRPVVPERRSRPGLREKRAVLLASSCGRRGSCAWVRLDCGPKRAGTRRSGARVQGCCSFFMTVLALWSCSYTAGRLDASSTSRRTASSNGTDRPTALLGTLSSRLTLRKPAEQLARGWERSEWTIMYFVHTPSSRHS